MKKIFCLLICFTSLFFIVSCSKTPNNTNNTNNTAETPYMLEYDMFINKIKQAVGPDEMFTSIKKISTNKSYDNNYTDLFTLTSMLYEKEYMMSVIYEGNSLKSVDIIGERNMISDGQYSFSVDYITLSSVIYQILNQQSDAYGIMVSDFNMTCQDAKIMKTKTLDNWIMIYSANNEEMSFHFQLK